MHDAAEAPLAPDPADAIRRWLAGDGPWLTVVGAPGVGKSHAVRVALADGAPPGVRIVDPCAAPFDPAPGQRIIAVGRRHLHPREHVVEVEPLAPEAAARVFAEAAAALGVPDPPTADDPAVAALVDRIGGHPLALILLARRLNTLSTAGLVARLDRPLAEGACPLMHAAAAPWRALRDRLDAEWGALDDAGRALLARCAVFAGPFTVEDAEAVFETADALDGVQALRDRCLLVRRGRALLLPPVIRRHARARAGAPDPDDARRHRARFAGLAHAIAEDVEADRMATARRIERIEAELTAIVGAAADPPVDAAVSDAARALAELCSLRGSSTEQARYARVALAAAPPDDPPRRLRVHLCAAHGAWAVGDHGRARALLDAVDAVEKPADHEGRWFILSIVCACEAGDTAAALALIDRALARTRALGSLEHEARVLNLLGRLHLDAGRPDDAAAAVRGALDILRRVDAPRLLGVASATLAVSHRRALRLDLARAAAAETLSAGRLIGDARLEGAGLHAAARIELECGRLADARRGLRACAQLYERTEFRPGLADVLPDLADCALEAGDRVEHQRLLDRADAENHGSPFARVAADDRPPMRIPALSAAIWLGRARGALALGDRDETRRQLERAAPWVERPGVDAIDDRLDFALLAHAAGMVEAARATWQAAREAVAGLPPQPVARRAALLGLALDGPGADALDRLVDGLEDRERSLWTRRALRRLWPGLPRALRREALGRARAADALALDRAGQALRTPGGDWQVIDRWPLWALVEALFDSPDPLEPQPLIERIWPDEFILPDAAANRLYNVVAKLRKAGLAALLLRTPGGYAFDPRCPRIEIDPDALDGGPDEAR